MATLLGHVPLEGAAGKTLKRSVFLERSIFLEWTDGSYTYIEADYDDDWSDVTPGQGWIGFSECPLGPLAQRAVEEEG